MARTTRFGIDYDNTVESNLKRWPPIPGCAVIHHAARNDSWRYNDIATILERVG